MVVAVEHEQHVPLKGAPRAVVFALHHQPMKRIVVSHDPAIC